MGGTEVHHTKENKPDFERKKNACFLAHAGTTVKLKDDLKMDTGLLGSRKRSEEQRGEGLIAGGKCGQSTFHISMKIAFKNPLFCVVNMH